MILRKVTGEDTRDFYDILSDVEVNTFLPWFPVRDIEETKTFLQKHFFAYYSEPSAYRYAICLKRDARPIGYVGLSENASNDFGYGLKKEFWHMGIATEAAKIVAERLKNAGFPYITATHDVNNPRSGEVMRKMGMIYRYSYVERWQPKDISVTFRMYQLNFDGDNERIYMEYWNKYNNHFVESGI